MIYNNTMDYTIVQKQASTIKKKTKNKTENKNKNTQGNKKCKICGEPTNKNLCPDCYKKFMELNEYLIENEIHGKTLSGIREKNFLKLYEDTIQNINLTKDEFFDYLYKHPAKIKAYILTTF